MLWHGFDKEVERLEAALGEVDDALPLMDAIRQAVVAVNQFTADDIPELRGRMELVGSVPALQASAAARYDAWERAIAGYAAARTGRRADSLYALAVGRTTLAACRTAFDIWVERDDAELPHYLDTAISGLASGFSDD